MKTYRFRANAGNGTIEMEPTDIPEPGPGEVCVRLQAASVNFRDLLLLDAAGRGELNGRVPLSDGAGVVHTVGPGVAGHRVGSRVVASFYRDWITGPFKSTYEATSRGGPGTDGVLAEYFVTTESSLVEIPATLSFQEAAALPCAAVTAWNGLIVRAGMTSGDRLLALGTGGVALFGLQFAVALGAEVLLISSSNDKLAKAKELGASVLINYRETPDWDVAVMEATDGRGATHILEVGGPETYDRSIRSVATNGTIVQIGVLTGVDIAPRLRRLTWENANIMGVTVGSAEHLAAVIAFVSEHAIHPVIDRVFSFDEAPHALEHLRSGTHCGKVVISAP